MQEQGATIARVCYRVDTAGGEDYDPEVIATGTLGPFAYHIRARIVTLTPSAALKNDGTTHDLLNSLIAAWNVDALLTLGPGAFQLQHIHTVDRGPGKLS